MASASEIDGLKRLLRHEVSLFCRHNNRRWKQAIATTVDEIREGHWPAVFFGGTLRSLLLSRLTHNVLGRPRDIDIVIRDTRLPDLQQQFEKYVARRTRFGGLQLQRVGWQFDVWPLQETHALKEAGLSHPDFDDLPRSTFFNLEAVAVDVLSRAGKPRSIYSADDQFFRGVIERIIEINREENPFPGLCVVRSVVMAGNLKWKVGPRLLRYLARVGSEMSEDELTNIQVRHYGTAQWPISVFSRAIEFARRHAEQGNDEPEELPLPKQLTFWPDEDRPWPRIRLAVTGGKPSKIINFNLRQLP
ncbi:MAG: hypothetical protein HZC55_00830 [Verrucomicrobia bacterium]|nr:hypothetical protein [Verrucomicrobiota bacterium]